MLGDLSIDYLKREDTPLGFVLNSIFDGVYIVDKNRKILFWNRAAEEITGYKASEVTGRSCADNILNHIDENGRLLCIDHCPLAQSMETGEQISAKVYPLCKSGDRFPVTTHIAPLKDDKGEIIAAIEVFRDVSLEEDFRILQGKFNKLVQRYVSNATYEEMLDQATSGHSESVRDRDLTILYLDMVGFTSLSERHSSEEAVNLLNDVFGMCDIITREKHGDIDKFIGDAILAIFIDANDAVDAGRTIVGEMLPSFNRLRTAQDLDPIKVRIGINSGIVSQGHIGTSDRKDLTVIGDVVNTAQRIESICEPDSLFISESAFARLSDDRAKDFVFHKEVSLKGKDESIRVFVDVDQSKV